MAPEARTRDLLYISNSKTVTVYSYPQGKLEGSLRFGFSPSGECADKKGDVFVTNLDNREIVEYAHGSKRPIQVLYSPSDDPAGCAIDPTTGNLAVSSLGFGNNGSVAIYKRARGAPTKYVNEKFYEYFLCSYDNNGNLFVDGLSAAGTGHFIFGELAKASATLNTVALNKYIGFPGGVQWDGKHVVIGDQSSSVIYRFVVSGNNGTEVGETSLGSNVGDVFQFFIRNDTIIVPNQCESSCTGNVLYYHYPTGGPAVKKITDGVRYPHGAVVSKAPKKSE